MAVLEVEDLDDVLHLLLERSHRQELTDSFGNVLINRQCVVIGVADAAETSRALFAVIAVDVVAIRDDERRWLSLVEVAHTRIAEDVDESAHETHFCVDKSEILAEIGKVRVECCKIRILK